MILFSFWGWVGLNFNLSLSYPMIEKWDDTFSKQNPAIRDALKEEDGKTAFELMNKELDKVWKEV
jgi:hypothetical protein